MFDNTTSGFLQHLVSLWIEHTHELICPTFSEINNSFLGGGSGFQRPVQHEIESVRRRIIMTRHHHSPGVSLGDHVGMAWRESTTVVKNKAECSNNSWAPRLARGNGGEDEQ